MRQVGGWIAAVSLSGCLGLGEDLSGSGRPTGAIVPSGRQTTALPPSSLEAATRVDSVGRALLAANPQVGVKPLFHTIGAPVNGNETAPAELFHTGTSGIYITETLVKLCKTDGELAALLAGELGKMIVEREASKPASARVSEPPPPMEVRIGNDVSGASMGPDQVRAAELARYERSRPKADSLPNAEELAKGYLRRAGHEEANWEAVAKLRQLSTQSEGKLERQLTGRSGEGR